MRVARKPTFQRAERYLENYIVILETYNIGISFHRKNLNYEALLSATPKND